MTHWTDAEIPDQTGRTALVTGANSGLGLHTTLGLARKGARVLMGCRDERRGADALARVRREVPGATVEILPLDLADLASVGAASMEAGRRVDRIDLLVNNAGVMALPKRSTADGFEMQFGTNHLGHFALTGRLLALLRAGDAPRVVTVSSGAHRLGRINFDDLQGEDRYRKWRAYGQSKLANLLFTMELQRRAELAGLPLVAVASHPGYAATNLQQAGPRMAGSRLGTLVNGLANRLVAQSEVQGALPSLYAATMPDVHGRDYLGPDGPLEIRGFPTKVAAKPSAYDAGTAKRLWDVSEDLTGVRYDFTSA